MQTVLPSETRFQKIASTIQNSSISNKNQIIFILQKNIIGENPAKNTNEASSSPIEDEEKQQHRRGTQETDEITTIETEKKSHMNSKNHFKRTQKLK
ncbi:hypothetical protein PIB30_030803, partial [Stylosanthes scabra]|nr:hypothetical protein [Stylosanthes scabra]